MDAESDIVMEFVIPDETYKNGKNPDAPRVVTEFVGVSDPRPTIELDEVSPGSVTIGSTEATVDLSGIVSDPIADNVPRNGGADIESVSISVGSGTAGDTIPLDNKDGDGGGFWKQHPYEGTMPSSTATIPLEEGTHIIRVETSANAAGNTGFDEVAITLAKEEVPGGNGNGNGDVIVGGKLIANIAVPKKFLPDRQDEVQFYYGERKPGEGEGDARTF